MRAPAWYQDPDARVLIAFRYLPWLAALSLAWEAGHMPLYTIWTEAQGAYIAFAIVHCTAGDVLIGGAALLLALTLLGERSPAEWRRGRVAALSVFFGAAYTVFSEWMNVIVLRSWAYAPAMPRMQLGAFEIGLTPLAQWLVIPPLALYLASRR